MIRRSTKCRAYFASEHRPGEIRVAVVLEILNRLLLHGHGFDPLALHLSNATQDVVDLPFDHDHERPKVDSRIGASDLEPIRRTRTFSA